MIEQVLKLTFRRFWSTSSWEMSLESRDCDIRLNLSFCIHCTYFPLLESRSRCTNGQ